MTSGSPLQQLYQQQELKLLAEQVIAAKNFIKNHPQYHIQLQAICLVLGPARFGKSTLLAHSGLKMINGSDQLLAQPELESETLITTTKSCDFWFSHHTLFIDTAGVYAHPEWSSAQSSTVWLGFVRLLRRHFGKRMLREALLVIDLPTLLTRSPAPFGQSLAEVLESLRCRVYELASCTNQLQLRIMITKCDYLLGFNKYFGSLDHDSERPSCNPQQPFGILFEQPQPNNLILEFEQKFTRLVTQLQQYDSRQLFPKEFAQLRQPLVNVLSKIPYGAQITLRGLFWVSSCQQDPQCLDPAHCGAASTAPLIYQAAIQAPPTNQPYFLTELFRQLDQQYDQPSFQHGWISTLAILLLIVGTLTVASWLGVSFMYNRQLLTQLPITQLLQLSSSVPRWSAFNVNHLLQQQQQRRAATQRERAIAQRLSDQLRQQLAELISSTTSQAPTLHFGDAWPLFNQFKAYLMLVGVARRQDRWLHHYLQTAFTAVQKLESSYDQPDTPLAPDRSLITQATHLLQQLPATTRLTLILLGELDHQKLPHQFTLPSLMQSLLPKIQRPSTLHLVQARLSPAMLNQPPLTYYLAWYLHRRGYKPLPQTQRWIAFAQQRQTANTNLDTWLQQFNLWWAQISPLLAPEAALRQQLQQNLALLQNSASYRIETLSNWLRQPAVLQRITPPAPLVPLAALLAQTDATQLDAGAARELLPLWQLDLLQALINNIYTEMITVWNHQIVPFYQTKLASRYPFSSDPQQPEASLTDFAQFFATQGRLRQFYRSWVAPFCGYQNGLPTWLPLPGTRQFPLEILEAVIRSDLLTQAFYGTTAMSTILTGDNAYQQAKVSHPQPASSDPHHLVDSSPEPLKITFYLIAQQPSTKPAVTPGLQLHLDGQLVDAAEPALQQLCWPGPQPGQVEIAYQTADGRWVHSKLSGSWAWFRLLEQAQLRQIDQQHMDLLFTLTDVTATSRANVNDNTDHDGQLPSWRFSLRHWQKFNPFQFKLLRGIAIVPIDLPKNQ